MKRTNYVATHNITDINAIVLRLLHQDKVSDYKQMALGSETKV